MALPVEAILAYLQVSPTPPTADFLRELMLAWRKRIPWETASRVARHQHPATSVTEYMWLPATYFDQAMQNGTGGTCFESNMAFSTLLEALGFNYTLHLCDMSADIDPHCALIVTIDGQPYMADVGLSVPAFIPLSTTTATAHTMIVYEYHATPMPDKWEITRRSGDLVQHVCFLKNPPISRADLEARILQDHEPHGLFLREVILNLAIDDALWGYSAEKGLFRRAVGVEEAIPLTDAERADLPTTLSRYFHLNAAIIGQALDAVAQFSQADAPQP